MLGMHLGLLTARAGTSLLSPGKAVVALLFSGGLAGLLIYRAIGRLLDWILAPKAIEGSVKDKRTVRSRGRISRYLTVGERVFDAGTGAFDSVEKGMTVRVIFGRVRKQILCIELIS